MKATKVDPELQLEIEQYYYHEAELLDDQVLSQSFRVNESERFSATPAHSSQ
jgi:3-phenylpropionate/cinnamic acid dioxygenase small subunit